MKWTQDGPGNSIFSSTAGKNAPWRADGLVVARSDAGWWNVWKDNGGRFIKQLRRFSNAESAKQYAEGLA